MYQYIDATVLNPLATSKDYVRLCEDAIKYQFPAVCVPPFQVENCRKLLKNSNVNVATVVGFPSGYQTIPTKIYELREMINKGAQEIDYVVHRGYLAENDWRKIEEETDAWVSTCREENITSKWIIEASEISNLQLDRLIEIANKIQPDYVKTSTGFFGKAILEQVVYLRKNLIPSIQIKAAGGISDRETAQKFIDAGADRIGVSQYLNLI